MESLINPQSVLHTMGDLESKINEEPVRSRWADIKDYWNDGIWNTIKRTFAYGSLTPKRQRELAGDQYPPWTSTFHDATIGSARSIGNLLIGGTFGSIREVITSISQKSAFSFTDLLNQSYLSYDMNIETGFQLFFNFIGTVGLVWNMYRAPYSIISKKPLAAFGWEPFVKMGLDKFFRKRGLLSNASKGKYDEVRGDFGVFKGLCMYTKYLYNTYLKRNKKA